MPATATRPRLLVLNQYYAPRVEATAHLLAELCEALAPDWDVTVVAGAADGEPPGARERNGVRVVRLPSTRLGKGRLAARAVDYGSYAAGALAAGMRQPRPDVVLAMTDPPFVGGIARAVAARFRAPLVVVCQDLFPETAVAVGALRPGPAVTALRALVEPPLRAAARVVALGPTMRRRLEAKGVRPERIAEIPNWVDTSVAAPGEQANAWAREHGLDGRFVVMHFGNLGYAQDLETLVRASLLLADVGDLAVAIVGTGSRRARLEALARETGAPVRFIGHQPRALAPLCVAAGSVHVVGLARGLAGFVVPSRLVGVLAGGRPVVAAAEPDSETAQLVERTGAGVVVPPGDPEALAAALRDAHAGRLDLEAMGARGREWAVAEADRAVAVERYRQVLEDVRHAA